MHFDIYMLMCNYMFKHDIEVIPCTEISDQKQPIDHPRRRWWSPLLFASLPGAGVIFPQASFEPFEEDFLREKATDEAGSDAYSVVVIAYPYYSEEKVWGVLLRSH